MSEFQVKKAERTNLKLRLNLSGLSGSGKTYSALSLAKGLVSDLSKVTIIETEIGRSTYYLDQFPGFNVIEFMPPHSPDRYVMAMQAAVKAGAELIIIDSVSDEWAGQGGALEMVNNGKSANTFANWKPVTPKHERFFNGILSCPTHVITTTKKKSDYIIENRNGKQIPKKVGLADIQREGSEYRYAVSFNIDLETHEASVEKDNTGLFPTDRTFLITPAVGEQIKKWCAGELEKEKEDAK